MEFQQQGYADQLNIETPEQVDLRFPVAGIGSRFVAILLDHLFQFLAYFFFIFCIYLLGKAVGTETTSHANDELDTAGKWLIAFIILVHFLLLWGYFALFEAFWHGQTPGKRIMKLRVIKDSGRQITFFESLARNLVRFVDILPGFYLAGVITMICNRKNKRLGDLAAGTMVVHEQPGLQPLLVQHGTDAFSVTENYFARRPANAAATPTPEGFPADAIARLQPNDLHVIEAFFARALDLDLETRASMAQRIAVKLTTKMAVPLPQGNPERALETIAKAMRGSARHF